MTDRPDDYIMTTDDYYNDWDTMSEDDRKFLKLPSKESYIDPADGMYVPTIEELRKSLPDIPANRNLTSDRFRKKIWEKPHIRFLDPLRNRKDADKKRVVGHETTRTRNATDKANEDKFRTLIRAMKKELMATEELDSYAIMVMYRNHALLVEKDLEKAAEISNKLLEYEKSKIGRTAPEVEETISMGKATDADLDAFNNDEISAEEFQRRMLG